MNADARLVWVTPAQRGLLSTFATHTPESQRIGTRLALAFDAAPEPVKRRRCVVHNAEATNVGACWRLKLVTPADLRPCRFVTVWEVPDA